MLTMDHAIVAFIGLLGFALIAVGGTIAASRRFLSGLASTAAGAALLVVLTTRIYPALLETTWLVERERLRLALARETAQIASFRTERDRALDAADQARAERVKSERISAEGRQKLSAEVDGLTAHLRRLDGQTIRVPETVRGSAVPNSVEAIIADLRGLRSVAAPAQPPTTVSMPVAISTAPPAPQAPQPESAPLTDTRRLPEPVAVGPPIIPNVAAPIIVEAPTAPASPLRPTSAAPTPMTREVASAAPIQVPQSPAAALTPKPTDVAALKQLFEQPVNARGYSMEPLEQTELVAGRKGRYYAVDVRSLEDGTAFRFASGRYTLGQDADAYRRALSGFIQDIVAKINQAHPVALFVRGRADRLNFQGRFEPGFEYPEITFLRNLGPNKYASDTSVMQVDGVVRNRELPNLRGAFLQSLIAEASPANKPGVLEGIIAGRPQNAERNAELIVFIGW